MSPFMMSFSRIGAGALVRVLGPETVFDKVLRYFGAAIYHNNKESRVSPISLDQREFSWLLGFPAMLGNCEGKKILLMML